MRVHLTESNALSFSPAGLAYLTELAKVTDEVRNRLKARVDACKQPHGFDALFQGESEVCDLIATLGPDTDLEALREVAALSLEEQERIAQLDLDIARLKTLDIPAQIEELKQNVADLQNLISNSRKAENGLNDEAVECIRGAIKTHRDCHIAAQRVSLDQFRSEHLSKTGSEVWYQFVEAAKALADAEQSPDAPYPQPDSRCLLCQQPLSTEACQLLLKLWAFLQGEAQAQLAEAQEALSGKNSALGEILLDYFDEQSVSHRYLQEHRPELREKVERFVSGCRIRRRVLQDVVANGWPDTPVPPMPESGIAEIEQIAMALASRLDELEAKDPAAEIANLEQQKRALEHRVRLNEHLQQVEEYVQARKWARQATQVGGSTRHITAKHNQLFKQLVTDQYIQLFEKMLMDLGRPLRVQVQTRGRKGATYKQIVVEANPSASADVATPDKVLSEGEKRAVALADFMTEVALDTTSSAVILDDPVTSLDLEWKGLIASILTEEAKRRQVITFTHDLPFLYFLKQQCEQEQVEIATHWIKRGDHDDKPGYVSSDNSPALERDYRKATRAREIYEEAKGAPAAKQEALLRGGFAALRTCYEAFIIFELFNEVVIRFDERISFGRLEGIVWDPAIIHDVIAGCEQLSRHMEGHLHSDALETRKPTPRMLLAEIEAFDALKGRYRALKNAH